MSKKILSPEEQAIEAIQRIETLNVPFCAVYVAMSKLQPENRGYHQLEIVSKIFEPLLNHAQARLFLLSNHDFLLLTANPVLDAIDDILYQIKGLFSDDFFISSQSAGAFEQIFFLDKDKDTLLDLLQPKVKAQPKNLESVVSDLSETALVKELTPEVLEKLLYQIEQNKSKNFIRRQSIISFEKNKKNEEVGQEFFTSLLELQNAYAPHLNLTADKALFTMLMDTLDKQMLSALCDLDLKAWPSLVSINLNVQSIFLPIFDKMLPKMSGRQLMIEFQMSDILHDLALYRKAYTKLKQNNILVALDAITINELEMIPMTSFNADCFKIFWSAKLSEDKPLLTKFLKEQTGKKIILSRCGSEEALLFGRQMGISLFQGHFVDTLLAAICKNTCTFGQECTLADCRLRRSAVDGTLRSACVHEAHLDAYVPLKEVKL
ncbi:MAG: hypothetical protein J6Y03_00485 [Alphaproteobacteria bacterium]|nr:hypothetical protein [Alphaproteobacteria bacterium]